MPLSYELWKLKTHFGNTDHELKIRELSDETESRIMSHGVQTSALPWVPPVLDHEL